MDKNVCRICNYTGSSHGGPGSISNHIKKIHKLSRKEYYDLYLKVDGDGICKNCGKDTPFLDYFLFKYSKNCSKSCTSKHTKLITELNRDPEFLVKTSQRSAIIGKRTFDIKFSNPEERKKYSLKACSMILDKDCGFGKRRISWKKYNGVNMRSPWEREFAQLCDENNIKWQYEPIKICYDGIHHYIPDFYLPNSQKYIEIKPKSLMNGINSIRPLLSIDLSVLDRVEFPTFFKQVGV